MQRENVRRLFFALWPADAVRAEIHSKTQPFVTGGRVVPPANFHITVLFLGEVAQPRVEAVERAGAQASAVVEGFELRLDRIEAWPRSKVLCLTATVTPPALNALDEQLRFNLLEPRDARHQHPLRPHVTLVRDFGRRPPAAAMSPVHWRVDDLALVESRLGRGGSTYTVIGRWPLFPMN